jgi:hypothetical protein
LGVLGILLYSILLVVMAVLIPGSSHVEEMCQPSERFCGARKFAFEIALRLLGISAVLDYLDVRRLKRRGFL